MFDNIKTAKNDSPDKGKEEDPDSLKNHEL